MAAKEATSLANTEQLGADIAPPTNEVNAALKAAKGKLSEPIKFLTAKYGANPVTLFDVDEPISTDLVLELAGIESEDEGYHTHAFYEFLHDWKEYIYPEIRDIKHGLNNLRNHTLHVGDGVFIDLNLQTTYEANLARLELLEMTQREIDNLESSYMGFIKNRQGYYGYEEAPDIERTISEFNFNIHRVPFPKATSSDNGT